MSAEENKALVRRWIEQGWNNKNQDVINEVFAADFIDHAFSDEVIGPAGVHTGIAGMAANMLDVRFNADHLVAEGDTVMVRGAWTGTHDRELQTSIGPLAPTGKRVTMKSCVTFRIAAGKIAESWGVSDELGMLQELGVIPGPEQAADAPLATRETTP